MESSAKKAKNRYVEQRPTACVGTHIARMHNFMVLTLTGLVVLLGSPSCWAFVAPTRARLIASSSIQPHRHFSFIPKTESFLSSRLFATSRREEEIAKLEEQLRKLREEQGNDDSASSVTMTTSTTATPDDEKKGNTLTLEEQKIVARLEMMKGKDMLLSETELMGEGIVENAAGDGSGGNVVFQAVGAIIGLVLLIAFAQIPVGQEGLTQYSATGSSTVKTIDLGDLNADARKP